MPLTEPLGDLPSDLLDYDDYFFETDDEYLYSELGDDWYDDEVNAWYGLEDEQGFPNYMPATTDPGGAVFVFTVIYGLVLLMMLPVMVVLGRNWEKRRREELEYQHQEQQHEVEEEEQEEKDRHEDTEAAAGRQPQQRRPSPPAAASAVSSRPLPQAAARSSTPIQGAARNTNSLNDTTPGSTNLLAPRDGSVATSSDLFLENGTAPASGATAASGVGGMSTMSGGFNTTLDAQDAFYDNGIAQPAAAAAGAGADQRDDDGRRSSTASPTAAALRSVLSGASAASARSNRSAVSKRSNRSNRSARSGARAGNVLASSPITVPRGREVDAAETTADDDEYNLIQLDGGGADGSGNLSTAVAAGDATTAAATNRPGDDSFESALRDIGANDDVLRSVLSGTSALSDGAASAASAVSDAVSGAVGAVASAVGANGGAGGADGGGNGNGTTVLDDTVSADLMDRQQVRQEQQGAVVVERVQEERNVARDDAEAGNAKTAGSYGQAQDFPPPSDQKQHEFPHHDVHFTRFPMKGAARGPRSAVSAAPTTMTTVSRFNRKVGGAFEHFADKIFIPSYPDDDRDYKSTVSGAASPARGRRAGRAATAIGSADATSLVPYGDAEAGGRGTAANDSFVVPRIPDALGRPGAGAGGRRRRGVRHGYGAIGRPDMIRRAIEHEERSEMTTAMTGASGSGAPSGHPGGPSNRSELAGRSALSGAHGGKQPPAATGASRISGPASEMMSGVQDDARSGVSGFRPWMRQTRSRMGGYAKSAISGAMSETPTVWKNFHEDDITPNDAADADDPGQAKMYIDEEEVDVTICCGQWALWKPKTIAYGADKVIELAEPDAEIKRIIRLGVPFTMSTVTEAFFDAVTVAVLSHYLGTNSVTAYVVVELMLGLTDQLVAGILDAQGTICSHAYGAGNNFLAGQYVQIALSFYVTVSIPFLVMWAFVMGDTLRILGFNEDIQTIGMEYTRVVIFQFLLEGVSESFGTLLDITGHEVWGLFYDLVHNLVDLGATLALVMSVPDARLVTVGFISLVSVAIFLVIMLAWATYKGWFAAFWAGMLGSVAICNKDAVKNVVFTAVPLSIGSFLEYGEWELLTFFTAWLGPAEVATWALLGSVWELFEASTEGMGEAAAVRVAYHLGKGNPEMAQTSAYKSFLLSFVLSVFVTAIFFLCGNDLPTWFSSDETIQLMLADLIPLVGFGNITMTFGMVSWSLVGAQGRYRLATLVSMFSSWFVTIPLSCIVVLVLNLNLKGLVGAVIVGYSTSAAMLTYILLRSDWERISKIIVDINALTGEIDSSDSEDEESSESSASESSDDSSDDSDDSDDDSDDSDDESSSSSDDFGDNSDLASSHVSSKHLLS